MAAVGLSAAAVLLAIAGWFATKIRLHLINHARLPILKKLQDELTVLGALRLLFPSLASLASKRLHFGLAPEKELEMPTGTVKFFDNAKGYGFITNEAGGNDAFVHMTAVQAAGMTTLEK